MFLVQVGLDALRRNSWVKLRAEWGKVCVCVSKSPFEEEEEEEDKRIEHKISLQINSVC